MEITQPRVFKTDGIVAVRTRPEPLPGDMWNNILILSEAGGHGHFRRVACRCACGQKFTSLAYYIRRGSRVSCGCTNGTGKRQRKRRHRTQHGTPERSARMSVMSTYRARAKKAKLVFELSKDYFDQLTRLNCVYCGVPPGNIYRSPSCRNWSTSCVYSGLDRISSAVGYVERNVVPCCYDCNTAKNDMNPETFKTWARRVSVHSHSNGWGTIPREMLALAAAQAEPEKIRALHVHSTPKFIDRENYLETIRSPLSCATDSEWQQLSASELGRKYHTSVKLVRLYRWRHSKPKSLKTDKQITYGILRPLKRAARRFVQSLSAYLKQNPCTPTAFQPPPAQLSAGTSGPVLRPGDS